MVYTHNQFTCIAFLFEKQHGRVFDEIDEALIKKVSKELDTTDLEQLEHNIITILENNSIENPNDRISAYWALGKRFNMSLIPFFRVWLKREYELDNLGPCFEIMISLNNMEENVFSKSGSSWNCHEQNRKDARSYLEKINLL